MTKHTDTRQTLAAHGIRHLYIRKMARDGQVRGVGERSAIQITYSATDENLEDAYEIAEDRLILTRPVSRITVPGALDITVEQAPGDLRLADIGGKVALNQVRGDLRCRNLTGGLAASAIMGDVNLRGPFPVDSSYTLTTEGDLRVYLPADADLRLTVRAGGRVRSDLPLTPASDGSAVLNATLGRGAGRMNLVCGGDLRISQEEARDYGQAGHGELRDLGDRIRQQVKASLAARGIRVETGEIHGESAGLGNWQRRSEHPSPDERPRQPGAPSHASSLAEQTAVLRMLQDGIITVDEAEMLLKALGEQA